jgi:hypothetical protein
MQSKLFVFAGLAGKNSNASLQILKERLESKLDEKGTPVNFDHTGELLSGELDDVSFYISFFKQKSELKDWFQMAKDFELSLEKKPVSRDILVKRYEELEKSSFDLYQKTHYTVGLLIIEEMTIFDDITVYSFQ